MKRRVRRQRPIVRQMTLSDAATPFGCCDFFDLCDDGIMSLHYGGNLGLLDWMGFNVSEDCYRSVEFINYVRPEMVGGVATAGYIGDPCDDPHGYEYGSCKLTVEDFGRIGRHGPVRDLMIPKNWCRVRPRWDLDGNMVADEDEWDMLFAMDAIIMDVLRLLITGNAATAGQFDGLRRWVRTGYDCGMLDSTIIEWNGNGMGGGAGMTWNGAPLAAGFNLIDVLLAIYRRIRNRISWSPQLGVQQMLAGDMILVMPNFMVQCLLDYYTCWSVCEGRQYNEVNMQTYEARTFRTQLLGGMFGFGQISLDGMTIPVLSYDWEMIVGPTIGDIFFLTGSVGPVRIWEGEHLSATTAAAKHGDVGYASLDGGRVLTKKDVGNECIQRKLWIHPRLFCLAPWAQARIQNVRCEVPGGPLSPDPLETSFYPETSFTPAECP